MRTGVGIRPGRSEAELRVPAELVATLHRLATDMGVSLGSVCLAAHARVLATLSGEREASTGYITRSGEPPLPLRIPVAQDSWRSLVREAHRAEQELPADAGVTLVMHARETAPSESLFDPTGTGGGLLEHTYLLVSDLDLHPRTLRHLRCVSVTGGVLTRELVRRWFALQPAIRLVNAYRLTETSGDTTHEIMDRPPDAERVPLGRPIQNVRIYVVDEHLSPVPLGAPGEIVVSGVCVARGYVNDPARPRRAFLANPHRKCERLHRSGEHGRWLPDGRLEFLERREARARANGLRPRSAVIALPRGGQRCRLDRASEARA